MSWDEVDVDVDVERSSPLLFLASLGITRCLSLFFLRRRNTAQFLDVQTLQTRQQTLEFEFERVAGHTIVTSFVIVGTRKTDRTSSNNTRFSESFRTGHKKYRIIELST